MCGREGREKEIERHTPRHSQKQICLRFNISSNRRKKKKARNLYEYLLPQMANWIQTQLDSEKQTGKFNLPQLINRKCNKLCHSIQ